jgi:hypothetical protein
MSTSWMSATKIEQRLKTMPSASTLAEHFWLSRFYERAVFHADYSTPNGVSELVRLTDVGNKLRESCLTALGLPSPDVTLAVYGRFFHRELLVDYEATDVASVHRLLQDDLLNNRIRFPYIWGRVLHDRYNDNPPTNENERLTNVQAWSLLDGTPIGVFQHGVFVSGPLGIVRSVETRWVPLAPVFPDCHVRDGTKVRRTRISFEPAKIMVVSAYNWIDQTLVQEGAPSEWAERLAWYNNRQCVEPRTDYADICPLIAECFFNEERTTLFESALKTEAGKAIRELMRSIDGLKGLKSLPPNELARKLSGEQQLQLLLTLPTEALVLCIDQLVLTDQITIPKSEVRIPNKSPPSKNMSFTSEISSLGIRSGHHEPFALLCSSILRAYSKTETTNELGWRLQSDPSRGLEVTLTDFIRREGPAEAVSKLVLASQVVTRKVCEDLQLAVGETIPRTETTIPRMLWKFGFEIARFDDTLARLNRWLQQFEDLLSQIDLSEGETARERIRADGVNLFVAVEKFLDRLLAFNVWLLASDHWGESRFTYRISDSRRAVSRVLGEKVETPDGTLVWKTNGENALGTQLAYLNEFELWLEALNTATADKRTDVDLESSCDHSYRPFPFRHTALWADSSPDELQRYREMFKRVLKNIAQADIAGIRNGIDHQRDESRFPTEESLWTCITRLKTGVRAAEQSRVYPVHYWFDSKVETSFGTSLSTFRNDRGESYIICRPATVAGLPGITRMHPVVFAPVNFLGAADALLFFQVIGESEYGKYWAGYPRISKVLPAFEESKTREAEGEREIPRSVDSQAQITCHDDSQAPVR